MTQFVMAEELAVYLTGNPTPPSADWKRQVSDLLQMIAADIQIAAGRSIEAGEGTVYLAGTWGHDLALPDTPVRSVTAVTVNGTLVDASSWEWNSIGMLRRGDRLASLDTVSDPTGLHWGGPSAAIAVDYEWGYIAVPQFVKSLSKRIAARVLPNPSQVSQESLGAYSVSYGRVLDEGGSHVNIYERRMLRKALNRTAGSIAIVGSAR